MARELNPLICVLLFFIPTYITALLVLLTKTHRTFTCLKFSICATIDTALAHHLMNVLIFIFVFLFFFGFLVRHIFIYAYIFSHFVILYIDNEFSLTWRPSSFTFSSTLLLKNFISFHFILYFTTSTTYYLLNISHRVRQYLDVEFFTPWNIIEKFSDTIPLVMRNSKELLNYY